MDNALNTNILESLILDSYQDLFSITESIMDVKRCENAYKLDMKSIMESNKSDLVDGRTERYNNDKASLIEKAKKKISEFLKYIRDKVIVFFNAIINFLKKCIVSDKKLIEKYKNCKNTVSIEGYEYTIIDVLFNIPGVVDDLNDMIAKNNDITQEMLYKFRRLLLGERNVTDDILSKDEFESRIYKSLRSDENTTKTITGTVSQFCSALDYENDIKHLYKVVIRTKKTFNSKFIKTNFDIPDDKIMKSLEIFTDINNSLLFTLNACKNAINERNIMIRQAILDGVKNGEENLNESYNEYDEIEDILESFTDVDVLTEADSKKPGFIEKVKTILKKIMEFFKNLKDKVLSLFKKKCDNIDKEIDQQIKDTVNSNNAHLKKTSDDLKLDADFYLVGFDVKDFMSNIENTIDRIDIDYEKCPDCNKVKVLDNLSSEAYNKKNTDDIIHKYISNINDMVIDKITLPILDEGVEVKIDKKEKIEYLKVCKNSIKDIKFILEPYEVKLNSMIRNMDNISKKIDSDYGNKNAELYVKVYAKEKEIYEKYISAANQLINMIEKAYKLICDSKPLTESQNEYDVAYESVLDVYDIDEVLESDLGLNYFLVESYIGNNELVTEGTLSNIKDKAKKIVEKVIRFLKTIKEKITNFIKQKLKNDNSYSKSEKASGEKIVSSQLDEINSNRFMTEVINIMELVDKSLVDISTMTSRQDYYELDELKKFNSVSHEIDINATMTKFENLISKKSITIEEANKVKENLVEIKKIIIDKFTSIDKSFDKMIKYNQDLIKKLEDENLDPELIKNLITITNTQQNISTDYLSILTSIVGCVDKVQKELDHNITMESFVSVLDEEIIEENFYLHQQAPTVDKVNVERAKDRIANLPNNSLLNSYNELKQIKSDFASCVTKAKAGKRPSVGSDLVTRFVTKLMNMKRKPEELVKEYSNALEIVKLQLELTKKEINKRGLKVNTESFTSVLDEEEFIYESVLDEDDTFVSVLDM